MKFPAQFSFLTVVLFTEALLTFQAPAYQFEVLGRLQVTNYMRGAAISVQAYDFEMSVSNDLWQLRSVDHNVSSLGLGKAPAASPGVEATLRMIAGTDGQSVYGYSVLHDGKQAQPPQGFVTSGPRPQFNPQLQLVWLAFASGEYLNVPTNHTAIEPPWGIESRNSTSPAFRTDIERGIDPPGLPLRILFYTPNSALNNGSTNELGTGLIGSYQVLSTTNYEGLSIPLRCALNRFKISGTNGIVSRFELTVDNVRKPSLVHYVPPPPKGMLVLDYRFRDKSLGYDITPYNIQNEWRQNDDPGLLQLATSRKEILGRGAIISAEPDLRRRVVLGVLAISLALPFLLFLIKTKRKL